MSRGDRFKLQPLLSTNHWSRYRWNGLRHRRSGIVVIFHGVDATQKRNECLRRLNKIKPQPKLTIHGGDWL